MIPFNQFTHLKGHFLCFVCGLSQYEPVLTKSFYHGRTEAMRTATEYAAAFCKTWCDPSATANQKLNALRVATQHHSAGVKLASQGKGVDRHLFALKCIAEKNGIATPDFFSSNAYKKLNHTILSTSNCGNPSLRCKCFILLTLCEGYNSSTAAFLMLLPNCYIFK